MALQRMLFAPRCMGLATVTNPNEIYPMTTEYLINSTRIRLTLPERGDCWFFVNRDLSVQDFKQRCQDEDANVAEVEVLQGTTNKPVGAQDSTSLYSLLADRTTPVFLRLNNIFYRFENQGKGEDVVPIEIKETSPWFDHCKQLGMTNLQASTLNTMIHQIESNLDSNAKSNPAQPKSNKKKGGNSNAAASGEPTYTVEQVTDEFVKQTAFFH